MKTIYFVRHGEAQANADGLLAGAKTDSPLTDKGRQQAADSAKALTDKPIDLVVTSSLSRASETAKIIAKAVGYKGEIVANKLFIERDFGSATGLPKLQAIKMLDDGTAEGMETVYEFEARVKEALAWLRGLQGEHILLAGHSAFGMMIRTVLAGGDPQRFHETGAHDHGQIYQFELND